MSSSSHATLRLANRPGERTHTFARARTYTNICARTQAHICCSERSSPQRSQWGSAYVRASRRAWSSRTDISEPSEGRDHTRGAESRTDLLRGSESQRSLAFRGTVANPRRRGEDMSQGTARLRRMARLCLDTALSLSLSADWRGGFLFWVFIRWILRAYEVGVCIAYLEHFGRWSLRSTECGVGEYSGRIGRVGLYYLSVIVLCILSVILRIIDTTIHSRIRPICNLLVTNKSLTKFLLVSFHIHPSQMLRKCNVISFLFIYYIFCLVLCAALWNVVCAACISIYRHSLILKISSCTITNEGKLTWLV